MLELLTRPCYSSVHWSIARLIDCAATRSFLLGVHHRRLDLCLRGVSEQSSKGVILPMSTHTAVNDASILTPEQALLTDQIGNEVYASHYAERKAYRLILACGTVLLCGSMWLNFSLARRPLVNRYIRIDEMGRAQAIQYSDLELHAPRGRGADLPHRLGQLPLYDQPRHHCQESTHSTTTFCPQSLASQLMREDNQNHLVSQVMAARSSRAMWR